MCNKQYIYWSIHRYTYIWGKSVLSVHVNKRQESLFLQDKKEKLQIFNVRLKTARLDVSAVFPFTSYSTVASIIKEVKKKVRQAGEIWIVCASMHTQRGQRITATCRHRCEDINRGFLSQENREFKKRSLRCLNWERHFRLQMFFFYC